MSRYGTVASSLLIQNGVGDVKVTSRSNSLLSRPERWSATGNRSRGFMTPMSLRLVRVQVQGISGEVIRSTGEKIADGHASRFDLDHVEAPLGLGNLGLDHDDCATGLCVVAHGDISLVDGPAPAGLKRLVVGGEFRVDSGCA